MCPRTVYSLSLLYSLLLGWVTLMASRLLFQDSFVAVNKTPWTLSAHLDLLHISNVVTSSFLMLQIRNFRKPLNSLSLFPCCSRDLCWAWKTGP